MERAQAEQLVKRACARAMAQNEPLIEVVRQMATGVVPDRAIDWQALAKPEHYLGATETIIDDVCRQARKILSL
jgi:adenylosuccinate lyase